jgi:hypothetical protein
VLDVITYLMGPVLVGTGRTNLREFGEKVRDTKDSSFNLGRRGADDKNETFSAAQELTQKI